MANPFDDESGEFLVLINDEGQYSLWPAWRGIPAGWQAIGPRGSRSICLAYVDEHWIDMRPRSLAARMAAPTSSSSSSRRTRWFADRDPAAPHRSRS